MAAFLLYSHRVEGEIIFLMSFLTRVLIPFMRAPPSWPNYLPKALCPNTVILGIRASTFGFWKDTNIQPISVWMAKMPHTAERVKRLRTKMKSFELQTMRCWWRRREQFEPNIEVRSQIPRSVWVPRRWRWQVQIKMFGASLVAQWLGICLPMQGTRVRALVWEDPACRGATGPVSHGCWACASGACAPQREGPRWWEARAPRWRAVPAPQWRVAPTCRN